MGILHVELLQSLQKGNEDLMRIIMGDSHGTLWYINYYDNE